MNNPKPDPLVGTVLADKYRLIRSLGSGGMATVYEAEHVEIGKRIAVKVIHPQTAAAPAMVERFMREARAAAIIQSPHICQVHDVDRLDDGRPFLVMDLLQGESLFERIQRKGRLDPVQTARIITQVCGGLARAHDIGLIHRDLKPENIFLSRSVDGEQRAVLLDFGLVGFYGERGRNECSRLTRDGSLFGTPLYMSPEQVEGKSELDPRSDLWSLACIVFESLTGQPVWDEKQGLTKVLTQVLFGPRPIPSSVCNDLPLAFDDWFAKATALEPAGRFEDARTFASALTRALGLQSTSLADTGTVVLSPLPDQADLEQAPTERPPTSGTLTSVERIPRDSRLLAGMPRIASLVALGVVVAGTAIGLPFAIKHNATVLSANRTAAAEALLAFERPTAAAPTVAPTQPAVTNPCQRALHTGQRLVGQDKLDEAISVFASASERLDCPAASGMLGHLRIAHAAKGRCSLSALSRPRPSTAATAAQHAAIVNRGSRNLVLWIDRGQPDRLLGAWLGASLIADESFELAQSDWIGEVSTIKHDPSFTVLYALGKGGSEGLWAVGMGGGNNASKPLRCLDESLDATAVRLGEQTLVIAPQDTGEATHDLVAAVRETSDGTPGWSLALTGFAGSYGPVGPKVSGPCGSVQGGQLVVTYRLERGNEHDIMFQRVPTAQLEPAGVQLAPDGVLGQVHRLSRTKWRVHTPAMACGAGSCLVAWRGMPQGVNAVVVDMQTGEESWRGIVSPRGGNVGVGWNDRGEGLVAWYESGKLWSARAGSKGLFNRTPIAGARGEHERPIVIPFGENWLVAWTTFEAGHPEPYVAEVRCAMPQ